MLIVARAASHNGRAKRTIKLDCRVVALLDFKEKLFCAALAEHRHGGSEKRSGNASASPFGDHSQGQKFGLVGRLARDEKSRRRGLRVVVDRSEQAKRVGARDEGCHGRLVPRSRETALMQRSQEPGVERGGTVYHDLYEHQRRATAVA